MTKRIPFFDLLRSGAAFAVVFGHLRNLFFCDYSPTSENLLAKAFYFLSGFGHQAVIIFFVLSGILIGQKAFNDLSNRHWSWRTYLFDRLTRLWIVLLPALVVTFVLDKIGMILFPDSTIYGGDRLGGNVISSPIQSSLWVYFGNALFLQQIIVSTAGSNGALWSLANEFWYYLTFPCLVEGTQKFHQKRQISLALVCGFFFVAWLIKIHFFEGFLIWAMGWLTLTAWNSLRKQSVSRFWLWAAGILFSGGLVFSRLYLSDWNDWILGVVTSFLCWSLVNCPTDFSAQSQKVWSFFSNFSFSLYLTHLPLLVFLRAALLKGGTHWTLDGTHFLAAILILTLCYFWAWLFSFVTEQKTRWLKDQLRGFSQKLNPVSLSP